LSVGWKESKYRQASSPDWIRFGQGYDKIRAFRRQIENMARAILGREPLLITSADALASVEVIDTAYRALRGENWVRIAADQPTSTGSAPAHDQERRLPAVSVN
jgi:predicted dehydrogenase